MPSLDVMRAANAKFPGSPRASNLVALFVGGTSGIAEQTMRQFYKNVSSPRVYFVGRSQDRADKIIQDLKAINPDGEVSFIKGDMTLLRNADMVSNEIKKREKSLNLIFMTSSYMTMANDVTDEGYDKKMVCNLYGRMRITMNLLPLLRNAVAEGEKSGIVPIARVVSVLSAGNERPLNMDDLALKKTWSLQNSEKHGTTMTSLLMESLSKDPENKGISFIHDFPGMVKTRMATGETYQGGAIMKTVMRGVGALFSPLLTTAEVSGEKHFYISTAEAFNSKGDGRAFLLRDDAEDRSQPRRDMGYITDEISAKVMEHLKSEFSNFDKATKGN